MAALADHDLAALVQFRPDVVVTRRAFGQRRAKVDVSDACGHLGDAVGVPADLGANLAVEIGFELDYPLAGVGYQRFMLFQLQREESLGVSQSLFAYVIAGRELEVRLRDLDVVTEDLVVADLERPYSAAFALARLELRQKIFPARQHAAQFVKLFGEARADDRPALYLRRRTLGDGASDVTDDVIAILQSPGEIGRRLLFIEREADRRDGAQTARERNHLHRRGDLPPNASEQSLDVEDFIQPRADLLPRNVAFEEPFDRLLPRAQFDYVQQRAPQPLAQASPAHRRHGQVDRRNQRPRRLAAGEIPALKDFQVAHRLRIEPHEPVGRVTLQPVQIGQGVRLSVAQVDDDRARGLRRQRAVFAAVSRQRCDPKMFEQRPPRRLQFDPGAVQFRQRAGLDFGRLLIARQQQFGRRQTFKLRDRLLDLKLGRGELPRSHIGVSQPRPIADDDQAGQVVVRLAFEQPRLDHGPGRDDSRDLAFDQPLARRRDLIANRDLVAAIDQLGQMGLNRAHRHARERMHLPLAEIFSGQREAQLPRHDMRVFVESLVKIADLEEEDNSGIAAFDFQILAAKRSSHKTFDIIESREYIGRRPGYASLPACSLGRRRIRKRWAVPPRLHAGSDAYPG